MRWRIVKENKMSLWRVFMRLVLGEKVIINFSGWVKLVYCIVFFFGDVVVIVSCFVKNYYVVFLGLEF